MPLQSEKNSIAKEMRYLLLSMNRIKTGQVKYCYFPTAKILFTTLSYYCIAVEILHHVSNLGIHCNICSVGVVERIY